MKGIIVTGGTGGHIFPAIAVGREFEAQGVQIQYFLVGNKVKNVKTSGITRHFKANSPFQGNLLKRFKNSVTMITLLSKGLFIIPPDTDFVIGTGSYASFSFLLAAKLKKIKTYMLEQNSIPGRVTRFFSKKGTMTFISFPQSAEYLKGPVVLSGNPIRDEAKIKLKKDTAREKLRIRKGGRVILVMGGSLGAFNLSKKILEISRDMPSYFFVVQAGQHFKKIVALYGERRENHFIIPFHEQPGILYSAADFVISRAGSGSIYELSFHKKPAIFVPYPFAKDNHQFFNAEYIRKEQAGILIKEEEISLDTIQKSILKLEEKGDIMSENLYNLFPHNAEKIIYKEILNDMGKV